jgi:hypothetical protein
MDALLNFLRDQLAANPARLIGLATSLALAGAAKIAYLLTGVETLPADVTLGITAITGFVVGELIRRFVFSPKTTQAIVDRAAATGETDIGKPPEGP